jgi:micrococcal nuclease
MKLPCWAKAFTKRIPVLLSALAVSGALVCCAPGCASRVQPTPAPYPTSTIRPTYTLYPSYTPYPTPTAAALAAREGWQQARVLRVTDGDTIEVALVNGTYKLRFIGIDAPEIDEPCYGEAKQFSSYLVFSQGKVVYLEKDTSEVDAYDRLLRYVWLITPDRYVMVNAELIGMGYAIAKAYPPDTKYQTYLEQMEQQALQSGLTSCRLTATPSRTSTPTRTQPLPTATPRAATTTPAPAVKCPDGCTTPSPGCAIKGNISSSGEKIYHVPGQRYYEQTRIDPDKGERWFCNEQEATANGWRKSKQ